MNRYVVFIRLPNPTGRPTCVSQQELSGTIQNILTQLTNNHAVYERKIFRHEYIAVSPVTYG